MVAEETAVVAAGGWNAWEELILGAAVSRHGQHDWNVVASELRARTRYPTLFTPEVCKTKYEDLQRLYSGSRVLFEELRKKFMAELKQELVRSEASIGFLESKIKYLEAETRNSDQADYACSQTESPLTTPNSDGTESSSKKISKEEQSAGSCTENTSLLCAHHRQEMERDTKPCISVFCEHEKDLSTWKQGDTGYREGTITRKRRGQRRRKHCNQAVEERSVCIGGSDNLGSSNAVSSSQNPDYDQIQDPRMRNCNGISYTVERSKLMEIFQSIAETEPAVVFRRRMDSQKRARYRKIVKQHVDIGTIRSRIIEQSITSTKDLFRDLLLLATNALVFYSSRTREYKSALALRCLVMKEYKQHCSWSHNKATSAFLPFNPPVKPRSARPGHQHRPHPCKDRVSEKLYDVGNIVPDNKPKVLVQTYGSEYDMTLHSLLKAREGLKMQGKVKLESVKQIKRICK